MPDPNLQQITDSVAWILILLYWVLACIRLQILLNGLLLYYYIFLLTQQLPEIPEINIKESATIEKIPLDCRGFFAFTQKTVLPDRALFHSKSTKDDVLEIERHFNDASVDMRNWQLIF